MERADTLAGHKRVVDDVPGYARRGCPRRPGRGTVEPTARVGPRTAEIDTVGRGRELPQSTRHMAGIDGDLGEPDALAGRDRQHPVPAEREAIPQRNAEYAGGIGADLVGSGCALDADPGVRDRPVVRRGHGADESAARITDDGQDRRRWPGREQPQFGHHDVGPDDPPDADIEPAVRECLTRNDDPDDGDGSLGELGRGMELEPARGHRLHAIDVALAQVDRLELQGRIGV